MIYAYGFFSVVKLPKFCKEVHDVMYNANRAIFADRDDLDELIEEVKTIFNAKKPEKSTACLCIHDFNHGDQGQIIVYKDYRQDASLMRLVFEPVRVITKKTIEIIMKVGGER